MRNAGLDILRALAVLMVVGHHAAWPDGHLGAIWTRGGWAGVDLFFVLSGFLVSGLLFANPAPGRFLVRRAWKIYPAFWALMLVTVLFEDVPCSAATSELFFVQNYAGGFWQHTWSLAVEEHFYLTLPFVLVLLRRWSYRPLPAVVAAIALASLAARLGADFSLASRNWTYTHLRFDSLWLGVAARYLLEYRPGFAAACRRNASRLAMWGGAIALSPFLLNMASAAGVTVLALGNAALVLGVVNLKLKCQPLQLVGRHSYSIYLWHMPLQHWLGLDVVPYMAVSLVVGIAMAALVEVPTLNLRGRLLGGTG